MNAHWADDYYGELYLATVEDLLTPRLSALEADVIAAVLGLEGGERVLDLACGHGRHAVVLRGRVSALVGVDRSASYLKKAAVTTTSPPSFVRADVRALPFAAGAFDAAYSWYSSLFMFDDATNVRCLREAARVVRPGGRLLVHHANPARLAEDPLDTARRTLRDGSEVTEESRFDPVRGVDVSARRLVRPDGAVLQGVAELRYYRPSEWTPLAAQAGLRVVRVTSTSDAGSLSPTPPGRDAPDLVVLLERT